MQTAIFGITNDGLNLAVNLILLILVVVWIALIVYTFLDARRRIDDPVLVACATIASFVPYVGTAVYAILRPPEYLEDARERELEIRAAEMKVRELSERSCPNCQRRLKDPCNSCGKPVDPRWALCPYCENPLPGRTRGRRGEPPPPGERRDRERDRGQRPERKESREARERRTNRPQRSSEGPGGSRAASSDDVPPPPPPPRRRSQAPPEGADEDGGSGGSRRRPEPPTRANR